MAGKDDGLSYPTEDIVSKSGRQHYRVPIRSQHWQLRSLISAEKRHLIYFPGGSGSNHVQRLNTNTLECETMKLLTFAPRCLVAENGWLCCGSETGEFVSIHLDEGIDSDEGSAQGHELDAETRRRLGLDGIHDEPLLALIAQARRANKSLIAKSVKLAGDRVNCITLWFPPTGLTPAPDSYTEGVAVLANNDRTVILVNLRDFERDEKSEPLEVVTYPDFVNRAIISPDGRLLVAILDDPYLYVHERVKRAADSSSSSRSSSSGDRDGFSWELKQKFLLKSQRKDDRSDSRGSFAACFSSSGAYLAVGTQHGTISIFDTALLVEAGTEPLITTFLSSRPESGPGAVRDMAFCPGPFDILAWTEDRGHIGFADMRTNFAARQVVDINVEADYEHMDVLDRNTIDPRLLHHPGDRRGTRSPSTAAARRRHGEVMETLNQPLMANETMVLEAIQSDRRRRDRISQRSIDDTSRLQPTDLTWTYLSTLRSTANEADSQRPRERSSSVGQAVGNSTSGPFRDQLDRPPERVRRQLAREASANQRQPVRRPEQRLMDRIGETVAAMRDQRERPDSSYLNVLEILQARERSGDADHEDSSLLVPLVNQAMSRWEESAIRGTLAVDHGVFEVPPSPDNTSGLAWTADGRSLFVGAQNGIYQLQVNIQGRKLRPSITMC